MELGLAGKVALVGGASRGIGLAIARAFAAEGARVVLVARGADDLEAARAAVGEDAVAVVADLRDERRAQAAVAEAVALAGGLDAVVANVGSGRFPGGLDVDRAGWLDALELNLLASTGLARAALPVLAGRDGASLTFVSTIAGREAIGAPVAYAAAKAGLDAAMKGISRLAAELGVRVNAVSPGNVLFPGGSWERHLRERGPEVEEMIRREVPLRRFGRPEEIADAVLFLASARASFVTGAALVVDGGQSRSL